MLLSPSAHIGWSRRRPSSRCLNRGRSCSEKCFVIVLILRSLLNADVRLTPKAGRLWHLYERPVRLLAHAPGLGSAAAAVACLPIRPSSLIFYPTPCKDRTSTVAASTSVYINCVSLSLFLYIHIIYTRPTACGKNATSPRRCVCVYNKRVTHMAHVCVAPVVACSLAAATGPVL